MDVVNFLIDDFNLMVEGEGIDYKKLDYEEGLRIIK
jgi:hypothetical protein